MATAATITLAANCVTMAAALATKLAEEKTALLNLIAANQALRVAVGDSVGVVTGTKLVTCVPGQSVPSITPIV